MKIKVIINAGVVANVLTDTPNSGVDVEVVNYDKDYADADELKAYIDQLETDPAYSSMPYTEANFEDNAAPEQP